jgi:hypothetical protein
MLLAAGCVPSLLSVMNGAEIDVPYPPFCTVTDACRSLP